MRVDCGGGGCKAELSELKVDGGMTANGLLMQFQSDIAGVPVVRPSITEVRGGVGEQQVGLWEGSAGP